MRCWKNRCLYSIATLNKNGLPAYSSVTFIQCQQSFLCKSHLSNFQKPFVPEDTFLSWFLPVSVFVKSYNYKASRKCVCAGRACSQQRETQITSDTRYSLSHNNINLCVGNLDRHICQGSSSFPNSRNNFSTLPADGYENGQIILASEI